MSNKIIVTALLIACTILSNLDQATAKTVTWAKAGYAGTWDTTTSNWVDNLNNPVLYEDGDDVIFPTFITLGGGSHYTNQTVMIDAGGVAPNSVTFAPSEINYLHFTGGAISDTAGGIMLDSSWVNNQARLFFEGNASHTFTGNVSTTEGNSLYYAPTAAGTYSLGTGTLQFADVPGGQTTSFNYEPTVTGTTLTNTIHAQSGELQINWGNAPTFTGNLILDSNVYFASVGGGNEYFDWNGDVILSGDRTIRGGVRDISRAGGLHFGGEFTGPAHTLTLDFQGGAGNNIAMHATQDTTAWNVGNLVLTNGIGGLTFNGNNTPNLLVNTSLATDDHFATLRANGGKVSIENGAQLFLRKGTVDFADLQTDTTGKVLIDLNNAAHDVRLSGSGMFLSADPANVMNAVVGFRIGSPGQLRGDITIGDGGVLTLTGQYNEALKHHANPDIADTGHLRMLDGSNLNVQWGVGISHLQLSAGYEFQSASQKLFLGDGSAATQETITFSGLESYTAGAVATGTLFLGTDNANIEDDGNVILRYESTTGTGDFNVGWSTLANITAMGYNNGTISYQFRGGSAGTEFAPLDMSNTIGAIGPTTGTVFTASSPTSLVTEGEVGFYNSRSTSPTGHRGNAGAVVIAAGGTFDLVAAGTAIASTWTVNNSASVSGIGTFKGDMTLEGGSMIAPGNSPGTLTIDGNLTMDSGAIYQYEFDLDSSMFDTIVVTGDLTANGTQVLQFTKLAGSGVSSSDEFLLFTVDGSLTNGLPSFEFFGDGFDFDNASVFQLGNGIFLTGVTSFIPEPSSFMMLGLGMLGLVRRRRRKKNA